MFPQRGKIVKPYNSVLGEHFGAYWNVKPIAYSSDPHDPPIITSHLHEPEEALESPSDTSSVQSKSSSVSRKKTAGEADDLDAVATALDNVSLNTGLGEALGEEEESDTEVDPDRVRVIYLVNCFQI